MRCQAFCNFFEPYIEITLEFEKEVPCQAISGKLSTFGLDSGQDSSKSNQNPSDQVGLSFNLVCSCTHPPQSGKFASAVSTDLTFVAGIDTKINSHDCLGT